MTRAIISIAALAGCVVAAPTQSQTHAETVLIGGKTYVRLLDGQLETMAVGRQIIATDQHAAHQVVLFFGKDGTYASYAGRDPLESGTYVVSNGGVLVQVQGEESIQRFFYRATDGELMMATRNGPEVRWTKVRAKPL